MKTTDETAELEQTATLLGTLAKNKRRKEQALLVALKRYESTELKANLREQAANEAAIISYPKPIQERVKAFGYSACEVTIEVDESDLKVAE